LWQSRGFGTATKDIADSRTKRLLKLKISASEKP
jgi:hypothetical protein